MNDTLRKFILLRDRQKKLGTILGIRYNVSSDAMQLNCDVNNNFKRKPCGNCIAKRECEQLFHVWKGRGWYYIGYNWKEYIREMIGLRLIPYCLPVSIENMAASTITLGKDYI